MQQPVQTGELSCPAVLFIWFDPTLIQSNQSYIQVIPTFFPTSQMSNVLWTI